MKKNIGLYLFLLVILFSLFGLLMIYSSSYIWAEYKFGDGFRYMKFQGLFLLAGIWLMIFISKIDYRFYYKNSLSIFIVCLVLLILVLIPGIGTVRNGSRSWFGIGSLGIQPSEFMKLSLLVLISKYLSNNTKEIKSFFKGILPVLLVVGLVFFLIMLQPDFGTSMIIVLSILALLFVAGADMKFFLISGVLGIIGIVILILIAPYRVDRITSFINPWSDPLGTGFQIIQSLYAIGPGGLFGLGLFNSRQKHFYLPEPQTDFIFSIISEELGIVGILIVSFCFISILYLGLKISLNSRNLFSKYLSFGITFQILIQAIMNLMVVVGLIPVTGVTLPFLSYGGSSLLITLCSIGVLLNISREI